MNMLTARMPMRQDTERTLLSLFAATPFEKVYQPDSTILLDGDLADGIYLVTSGTVRCCTINADGNRQIFRFAKQGDVLGLSDIETWHFTAEAVDQVKLKTIPRNTVELALAVDSSLRHEVRSLICGQLECREQQLLSMMTRKAPERLLDFLRDFAKDRPTSAAIVLPMCRRDIADHLGMSVETVSRAFGHLKAAGLIELVSTEKYRLTGPATGLRMHAARHPSKETC